MRKFYQESWQGIPFPAFAHVSFFHLASNEFYASFFEELFRRFHSWECLPEEWRKGKDKDAKWLAEQIVAQQSSLHCQNDDNACPPAENQSPRVLSIARGVGYLEKSLLDHMPNIELHVNGPNTAGMRWLREIIPTERIYIGSPAICLPPDIQYDIICLSAVDYGFTNEELALILRELKGQLAPQGKILCISASLLVEESAIGSIVNTFKIGLRAILHFFALRRQQFWGWRRTRAEYHNFFTNAGFDKIKDGWLKDGFKSYWISGE